ncbi:UPF0193 protein EVG1-like [Oscarella lobularis]|uniref:UPF0193 protein EVG1-like n=1 Tax=Oscarella lobularis TaxID=121494 RepID=UPI00331318F5
MASHRKEQSVARGGLFNPPRVEYSKETQDLLKRMMAESKLTNLQQRKLQQSVTKGNSLPIVDPTRKVTKTSSATKAKRTDPKMQRSGLRSKEAILESEAQKTSFYRPPPGKYVSSEEKEKLQNRMAFGCDIDPTRRKKEEPTVDDDVEIDVDQFDEVIKEIEERRQFLDDMEAIGKGKAYRAKIEAEISQKIRELEVIDQERSAELNRFTQSSQQNEI